VELLQLKFDTYATAGTPKAAIDRLAVAAKRAVQSPELRERFDKARRSRFAGSAGLG
jgi:tripartite-type tricarboxylate transporter receptor subunit TctC